MTTDWKLTGSCTTQGHPDDWFPSEGKGRRTPASMRRREMAVAAICAECPVKDLCLEAALANQEPHGIWGGLNPSQRAKILAKRKPGPSRRPIAHGTEAGYYAHRRRGEAVCGDCRLALNTASNRRRNERKKEAA